MTRIFTEQGVSIPVTVIYVEPNNARVRASSFNQNNAVLISAIGTLTTILAVFLVNN